MWQTRVSSLLAIEYPILAGGMNVISNAELAAAVSNAGGLGIITPFAGLMDPTPEKLLENLRAQIRLTKSLTRKPFGINFSLSSPIAKDFVTVALEEGFQVATTSAGSPSVYTKRLKDAGVKVLHLVASVKHAKKAEAEGVDGVIAEGFEAGGHNGNDELPTLVLVPQVVDAVKIPVVAAGGIADSRGVVAAIALGAEGVQIGTRFIATTECIAHLNYKNAIINAPDTGTAITGRSIGGVTRAIKSPFIARLQEMEASGAPAKQILDFIGTERIRLGELQGDLVEGEVYSGAIAGMIRDIKPAGVVLKEIVDGIPAVTRAMK